MIPIQGTINPEVIERELARLWQETTRAELQHVTPGDERATIRARVANLMIYASGETALDEVNDILGELSARHPCRALVMTAAPEAADRDIEIVVDSFCRAGAENSRRKLCCEEVSLNAQGRFVAELPSAAIPLLVPDLPVFLWWRAQLSTRTSVFAELVDRADRVIVDSADFRNPGAELAALASLLAAPNEEQAAFSDMNWERLTSWRALLAGFFDPRENRATLDQIVTVRIDYAAGEGEPGAMTSQPLLIAGWLASRLDWKLTKPAVQVTKDSQTVKFEKNGRQIRADCLQVERHQLLPGRLARVRLATDTQATFEVTRSDDGLHLQTSIDGRLPSKRARVSQSHTRSIAELLGGEMDILCPDRLWEDALRRVSEIAS